MRIKKIISTFSLSTFPAANARAFYEIFEKEDPLSRYTQIFENVLLGICALFNFISRISGSFA